MADALVDSYDAVLLDLDGTVYRGATVIRGAAEAVGDLRSQGRTVRFVTNNASRRPGEVLDHLRQLGFAPTDAEISTSAQAAARFLGEQLPSGSAVLVVGTEALAEEIVHCGLAPVRSAADAPAAVVQGHSPDTGWRDLAEACVAIRAGARWVACNVDNTLPTERGELPGNGAMVAALRAATGRKPEITGKPARRLLDDATQSAGARRPLVVGDRLDTDIAGAVAAGMDSLLVLTGVSTVADLLAADASTRPTYVAADLGALAAPSADSAIGDTTTSVDGWTVTARDGLLELTATSSAPADGANSTADGEQNRTADARGAGSAAAIARVLCPWLWTATDQRSRIVGADDTARRVLAELGIAAR